MTDACFRKDVFSFLFLCLRKSEISFFMVIIEREPIVRKCRPLPSGNGFVQVIHKVDALTDEDLGERGDAAHVNGHHLDGPKPD